VRPSAGPRRGAAATLAPDVRPIGSDFELVQDRYLGHSSATALPWEDSAGTVYVQSGRQALGLVGAELKTRGHTLLHVPSYLCDSMISPFASAGWRLRQLGVDGNLGVDPADLLAQVTSGVLLHAPYFGRSDSPAMLAALDTLRARGVVVIADESHRLFSPPCQVADFRVASLRKLLPVYDGGYVSGLPDAAQRAMAALPAGGQIAELRQMAQIAKTSALGSGASNDAHLALFAAAEQATDLHTDPAPISAKSASLLHRLNLALMAAARAANCVVLATALGQSERFRVINAPATDLLPSHLVLETDDVSGLRHYLSGRQIYCPVHWPPSRLLTRTKPWPGRYLSLPVDQRYGEQDMVRLAGDVTAFFAGT
jgi:hypothetical protein